MKLTAVVLTALLICPSAAWAEGGNTGPIQQSAERAIAREVTSMAQAGADGGGSRNPFMIPGLAMVGAGIGIALAAAKVPKLKTQTLDYDRCAQANGVATGPSNFASVCGQHTETNKPLQMLGIGTAAAGLATLTISSIMRSVTVQVSPSGVVIGKTRSF